MNNYLKLVSRLEKQNGNGVFLKIFKDQYGEKNYILDVVYSNGWLSDSIVIYDNSLLTYAGNTIHCETTKKAIRSLIKYYHNFKLN